MKKKIEAEPAKTGFILYQTKDGKREVLGTGRGAKWRKRDNIQ